MLTWITFVIFTICFHSQAGVWKWKAMRKFVEDEAQNFRGS